jgi:hypothetical protein
LIVFHHAKKIEAGCPSESARYQKGYGWGQIFILDIVGWRRGSMRFLLKKTKSKVKDKDLTPMFFPGSPINPAPGELRRWASNGLDMK